MTLFNGKWGIVGIMIMDTIFSFVPLFFLIGIVGIIALVIIYRSIEMKSLLSIIIVLVMATSMAACGVSNEENNEVKTETMPEDYGDAVIVAQNEFNSVFIFVQ